MVGHGTIAFILHANGFWPPENVNITHYITIIKILICINNIIYIIKYILQDISTNRHEQFLSDEHQTTLKSNRMNKDDRVQRRIRLDFRATRSDSWVVVAIQNRRTCEWSDTERSDFGDLLYI
jgi:hypothetical protein